MYKELQVFTRFKAIINMIVWCVLLFFASELCGVIDNRFRDPLINHHTFVTDDIDTTTILILEPFAETARHSADLDGREAPLFDYASRYDLADLNRALVSAHTVSESLLPTYWTFIFNTGHYRKEGRFDTQGVAFHLYHAFACHWAVGVRGEGLHATSCLELVPEFTGDTFRLGAGDEHELMLFQEKVHDALAIDSAYWTDTMLGDAELYLQYFSKHLYVCKCRYIDLSLSLGAVIPAAPARELNNPASLPMGGNRHWGVFIEGQIDAILRHDMRAGCVARVQKRLSKVSCLRVPHIKEPDIFGAIVGPVNVDPGPTLFLAPYFIKEGLREGLGMRIGYTLVKHFQDSFSDRRADRSVAMNCERLNMESEWGQDYVTLGFLYDFAYGKKERCLEPVFSLTVDAPVNFIVSSRSFRTYGISFSIELNF